jgi:HprK-related kinase A
VSRTLEDLDPASLRARLRAGSLRLRIGPFVVRVRSGLPDFAAWVRHLYAEYPLAPIDGFSDFHIRLDPPSTLRRWWRPQVQFELDGDYPFKPLPRSQARPFFEWGLNWCVAERIQDYVTVHAAVVERDGLAVIMPGEPGAGKSTLCAGLVARGWRLLSDELALLRPEEWRLDPFPRPVSLKDESISVIRAFAPEFAMGPPCHDTAKGTVVHVRVPTDSVRRSDQQARPAWLVFPAFERGAGARMEAEPPERAFRTLIDNAFNYSVQGRRGFHGIADLVERCPPWRLVYGDLAEGCRAVESLVASVGREERVGSGV